MLNLRPLILKRDILLLLLRKEFRLRYKGSAIGYLWAILNPLCFAAVYFIAFKVILRFGQENYAIQLIVALFPWMWIVNSLVQGTNSIRNNLSLVKKVSFNYVILPLSNVLHDTIHFIFCLPIMMIFIWYADYPFYLSWLWQIPFMILIQIVFLLPIVIFLSSLNVFIRDIEYIISLLLSMLFFLTPIIYPITIVPAKYLIFYKFNLIAVLIENWRLLFFEGTLDYGPILFIFLISLISLLFTYKFFLKKAKLFGEVL